MTVIDSHTHVWLAHAEKDRRELLECVEEVPLRRLYVSGLQGYHPDEDTVVAINDAVAELMRADERVRGQLYLNPRHHNQAREELQRCRDLGFGMVKLWQATRANNPLNFPIYEQCIEHRMPVLLHCFCTGGGDGDKSTPEDVAEAARRYPELTIQMAHLGGDFIRGVAAIAELANVSIDCSGTYGERGMVDEAVNGLGAERIIFGSDMPGSDVYHNLGKVYGAKLTPEQRELILWKNAERILP